MKYTNKQSLIKRKHSKKRKKDKTQVRTPSTSNSQPRRASGRPARVHCDAWRILLYVVKGKELLPAHARDYCSRALARIGRSLPAEGVFLEDPAAAEGPPRKKSRETAPIGGVPGYRVQRDPSPPGCGH